jgi:hypothetical protein
MNVLIYTDLEWSLGALHRELAHSLTDIMGWNVQLKSWAQSYEPSAFAEEAARFDCILTLPSCARPLHETYRIAKSKIAVVAHAEVDIQKTLAAEGGVSFHQYRNYGVTSDTLACSSLSIGVTRVPAVLRCGIDTNKFYHKILPSLSSVGYATLMERRSEFGVEQKRGALAQACAHAVGLPFIRAENVSVDDMPAFYKEVSCLIMPSLQDGSPRPPLEAAAAGRLVIGTPVGHFPRLAYEGLGILGPLNDKAFLKFAVHELEFFKTHTMAYREKCQWIQTSVRTRRDWGSVIGDWVEFLEGSR